MDGVARVAAHATLLLQRGGDISLEAMKDALPSDELLGRMLVVEFGSDTSVFEALAPERYLFRGREVLAHEVGEDLF